MLDTRVLCFVLSLLRFSTGDSRETDYFGRCRGEWQPLSGLSMWRPSLLVFLHLPFSVFGLLQRSKTIFAWRFALTFCCWHVCSCIPLALEVRRRHAA